MDQYACIIQEGQIADQKCDELEAGLKRLGAEFFGDDVETVGIRWTRQPEGWAWTAGEPSTSSIVVPIGARWLRRRGAGEIPARRLQPLGRHDRLFHQRDRGHCIRRTTPTIETRPTHALVPVRDSRRPERRSPAWSDREGRRPGSIAMSREPLLRSSTPSSANDRPPSFPKVRPPSCWGRFGGDERMSKRPRSSPRCGTAWRPHSGVRPPRWES